MKCEYCRAKIPIVREKIIHVQTPLKPKSEYAPFTEKEKANLFKTMDKDETPFFDYDEKKNFFIIGILVFTLIATVIAVNVQLREDKASEKERSVKESVVESN